MLFTLMIALYTYDCMLSRTPLLKADDKVEVVESSSLRTSGCKREVVYLQGCSMVNAE